MIETSIRTFLAQPKKMRVASVALAATLTVWPAVALALPATNITTENQSQEKYAASVVTYKPISSFEELQTRPILEMKYAHSDKEPQQDHADYSEMEIINPMDDVTHSLLDNADDSVSDEELLVAESEKNVPQEDVQDLVVDTNNEENTPYSQQQIGPKTIQLHSLHISLDPHAHDNGGMNEPQPGFYVAHSDTYEGQTIFSMRVGDTVLVDNRVIVIEGIYNSYGIVPFSEIRDAISWDVVCFKTCIGPDTEDSVVAWGHPAVAEDFWSNSRYSDGRTFAEVAQEYQMQEEQVQAYQRERALAFEQINEQLSTIQSECDELRELNQFICNYGWESQSERQSALDDYHVRLTQYNAHLQEYNQALDRYNNR